jgi:aminocarboxymuconate-semialdehyde decarboxylase
MASGANVQPKKMNSNFTVLPEEGKGVVIDTHAHALDKALLEDLCRKPAAGVSAHVGKDGRYWIARGDAAAYSLDPNLSDIESRIASLARRGVDLQLIAPPPGFVAWPDGAADVEWARTLNEHGAMVAAQGHGKLEVMATLALAEPERCAYELERAVDRYGARSALLPTTAGRRPLDSAEFEPLFRVAEKLGVLFFMHPTFAEPPSRFPSIGVQVIVQLPFETTLAVTRMIFEGVLERHPGLQLLLAHGGGDLLFLKGRLNAAYEATGWEASPYYRKHISKAPGDYYGQLYFDTCSLSAESVDFTIQLAGPDRVMFGTDYPFDIGDAEGERARATLDRLPTASRLKILGENARAVLGALEKVKGIP